MKCTVPESKMVLSLNPEVSGHLLYEIPLSDSTKSVSVYFCPEDKTYWMLAGPFFKISMLLEHEEGDLDDLVPYRDYGSALFLICLRIVLCAFCSESEERLNVESPLGVN